jgi:Mrp family chromosome partitioning ATPase
MESGEITLTGESDRSCSRTTPRCDGRLSLASMTRIVVVTSGKGGVGKTTTSASFSSGLALRGFKTAVIDFDVGLRNLDLIMGCERRVVYDLINVINGEATLTQALIKDKHCTTTTSSCCPPRRRATRTR